MMFSLIPAFSGMLALSLLPTDSMKWVRWGMYILQIFGGLPGLSTFNDFSAMGVQLLTVTFSDLDVPSVERGWTYEEDCHGYGPIYRFLCWQRHRSPDAFGLRRPEIRPRHYCLCRSLLCGILLHGNLAILL